MSPDEEMFAALFGAAVLVLAVGVVLALQGDARTGTVVAAKAAAAAAVAYWAMRS